MNGIVSESSPLSTVMSPVQAMRAVQVFSVLLFGAMVLLWLRSERLLALAPVAAGLLIVAEFGDAARASTPDVLCSALFMGGLLIVVFAELIVVFAELSGSVYNAIADEERRGSDR